MATFTVLKFPTAEGAERTLATLERPQREELIKVHDAAIVSWPADRKKPKTEQLRSLGGRARSVAPSGAYCSDCSSSSHCSEWRSARRWAGLPAR